MTKEDKTVVMKDFARHGTDVGSAEVQVAVLTQQIKDLTEHMKIHRKDHSTRRGLIRKVNRRRTLLQYLRRTQHDRYMELVKRLQLRH